MSSVIAILEQLESVSGSNAKREILEAQRSNELLKRAFVAAFDPYTVFYVSKFPMPPSRCPGLATDDDVIYSFLNELLPTLSNRKLTGNAAKEAVVSFFDDMSALQQKWCQRILLKNLRCGVQQGILDKVWPGLIQSFKVALACTLKSQFVKGQGIQLLEPVQYPVRVEPKLDGLRCIAVKQAGKVTFYTRNGTVLESMPKIKAALEAANYDDVVLDGEGMAADWGESSSVMMSGRGSGNAKDDSNLVYNVFDALPLADWIKQETSLTYADRAEGVYIVMLACVDFGDPPRVRQVPHVMVQDEKQLKAYFTQCMDEGYEGVMLKTLDSTYKWDRSRNILKLKPVTTYEGTIVGHYQGRRGTKREGLFSGFEVLLPNGIVTRVGGGFSDALKAQVQLEGPDTYVGRIVELEAQPDPQTTDGLTADGKARFPVLLRFRDAADVDPKVTAAYAAWKASK